MKRGLVAAGAVALLLLTGCSASTSTARPDPAVTVTETVRVPAPEYTPQDDAAVADAAGVSEFAVAFVASYKRETGVELTPADAQERLDTVCDEIVAGVTPDAVTSLPEATDPAIRALFAQSIQSRYCEAS